MYTVRLLSLRVFSPAKICVETRPASNSRFSYDLTFATGVGYFKILNCCQQNYALSLNFLTLSYKSMWNKLMRVDERNIAPAKRPRSC